MAITSEAIAYWYLRLNGFMTIVNFLVHPETTRDSSTDVDILGVRFPYRSENIYRPMKDDSIFSINDKYPLIILAEVKRGQCNLNGPWVRPGTRNMEKVLRAIGSFKIKRNKVVSKSLYERGMYLSKSYHISMVCIGNERNYEIEDNYPNVPQIIYSDALKFIYDRLTEYRREKAQHSQWDKNGHYLWNIARDASDSADFCSIVMNKACIRVIA